METLRTSSCSVTPTSGCLRARRMRSSAAITFDGEALVRTLIALALAALPLRAAVSQADGYAIRGVVMVQSRQLLDAVIQFADGSPNIRTDSLGNFA